MFFKRVLACLLAALVWTFPAQAEEEQVLRVLLIGVDGQSQEARSDAMMLAQIDVQTNEIKLVSFLRDLYVSIPGHGRSRLNAAYTYGGEELLKETLLQNFNIHIDRTVTMHFSTLAEMVDQLGGIELDVTEAERRHLNKLLEDYGGAVPALETAGLQRLNGLQALTYSRIRKIDSDFQRTSRQQTLIAAMLKEMTRMSKWELFKMAVSNLGKVETDLSLSDLYRLSPLFQNLSELQLQSAHVPFDGAYTDETINGMMVLQADHAKTQTLLNEFLTQ